MPKHNGHNKLAYAVTGGVLAVALICVAYVADPAESLASKDAEAGDQTKVQDGKILGMWVWQPQWVAEPVEQDRLIAFCTQHGLNRLLVQIHMEKGSVEAAAPVLQHQKQLRRFLKLANEAGIQVEALDGEIDMGRAVNHAKSLAILDGVLEFNRTQPPGARFAGMHYDIEPYVLPQWNTEHRRALMRECLLLYQFAHAKLAREDPPMELGASIPFWYDHLVSDTNSCMVEFRGARKNFQQHIQDHTDYVAIMSYRRHAEGENSITYHVKNEMAYGGRIGKKVCAALETIELHETPDLTFHGLSPEELWLQKNRVDELLQDEPGYGGIMIHDYQGFRRLLSQSEAQAARR